MGLRARLRARRRGGLGIVEGLNKSIRDMENMFNARGLGGASSMQTEMDRYYMQEFERIKERQAVKDRADAAQAHRIRERKMRREGGIRPPLVCRKKPDHDAFIFSVVGCPDVYIDMMVYKDVGVDRMPSFISGQLIRHWNLIGPWPSASDVVRSIAACSNMERDRGQRAHVPKMPQEAYGLSLLTPRNWLNARIQEVTSRA